MIKNFIVAAGLLSGLCSAQAQVVFADNFDADAQGVNYTAFVNGWTVGDGTVDLVGTGFFNFYPGNGNYVDLDGSTSNAGVLSRSLTLTGGTTYTASFSLGGSTRGDSNLVDVGFGTSLASFTLLSSDPLATQSLSFTPLSSGSYSLSFANFGGDNLGAILDNVVVSTPAIPEPETYALMLAGLGAVGYASRRRKQARK
jgi:hypothetical protein